MKAVFVGGSRRISRVNTKISERLSNIISNDLDVIVGDANGFDRAAQDFFKQADYQKVTVYCTGERCRNNVGNWRVRNIEYRGSGRGREFYTAKDIAMIQEASYGLVAWDGKSAGTLRNIEHLAENNKPTAVYISTQQSIFTVRSMRDFHMLGVKGGSAELEKDLFSSNWRDAI